MATTRTKVKAKQSERAAKPDKATLIPPETNSLMGRRGVAAVLDVSLRTFTLMVREGDFPRPSLTIGKSPRWTREEVNAEIRQRCELAKRETS